MKFKLLRHKQTAFATFGTLFDDAGRQVCVTLELPFVDADNDGHRDANAGRAVHGTYRGIRRVSPKRGYPVWWLCGVPDYTLAGFPDEPTATTMQLHRANTPDDLRGCIGLGSAYGKIDGEDGITGSQTAFEKFMALTKDAPEITLEIVDAFGTTPGTWA